MGFRKNKVHENPPFYKLHSQFLAQLATSKIKNKDIKNTEFKEHLNISLHFPKLKKWNFLSTKVDSYVSFTELLKSNLSFFAHKKNQNASSIDKILLSQMKKN
ncbi:CLUMA_CG015605, isoform A [Clunio marinus]|uniref:CLUMA_CG015605, isoform A n=1 Tax=Clunio marinus TaxID=568069 RepID=A0A1J1IQ11_9DIPT|nr:CLUMA_CG015605, isoform A [Clunio marinus]